MNSSVIRAMPPGDLYHEMRRHHDGQLQIQTYPSQGCKVGVTITHTPTGLAASAIGMKNAFEGKRAAYADLVDKLIERGEASG